MDISVVVPVYKSAQTLTELVGRIAKELTEHQYEVILVDDGSNDESWPSITRLASKHDFVRGVRLGRNFGQHSALLAGLRISRYSTTVTIDDDLQNPPEEIRRMVAALTPEVDLVYGVPVKASQPAWRRAGSAGIRHLIVRALGGTESTEMSSFRAFKTNLREAFSASTGPNVSIDALLSWATDKIGYVNVQHHSRQNGTSNYTFRKLLRFSIDMATGYSTRPLRLAGAIGALCVVLAVLLSSVTAALAILGDQEVPGFTTTVVLVCLFSGVQLISLGILGEYVARMHFRIMNKPSYFIAEIRGGERHDSV